MKEKITNFRLAKIDFRPEDYHSTVELWYGDYNGGTLVFQIDKVQNQYRHLPYQGYIAESGWKPLSEIEHLLKTKEFEWDDGFPL